MYCAPIKPPKSARSVRAQRHTDMPKAQKVCQAGKNSQQPTNNQTRPTKKKNQAPKKSLCILAKENSIKAGNRKQLMCSAYQI